MTPEERKDKLLEEFSGKTFASTEEANAWLGKRILVAMGASYLEGYKAGKNQALYQAAATVEDAPSPPAVVLVEGRIRDVHAYAKEFLKSLAQSIRALKSED